MRKGSFFAYMVLFIIGLSCSDNTKTRKIEILNPCMPGFILIVYIGENSAPVPALLMRTDEKDSTYYKRFVGEEREMFLKNDFIIDESWEKFYMNKFYIDTSAYSIIKRYIIKHKTNKNRIERAEDYSSAYPFKIILSDKCDSIVYVVDNRDSDYFKQLLDSTTLLKNEELKYLLNYFRKIQDSK